jgi:hypothetical protein
VRDDARGGQVVKAKCGADVVVQLFQGSDPQPLQQAGVQVKVGVPPSSPPPCKGDRCQACEAFHPACCWACPQ